MKTMLAGAAALALMAAGSARAQETERFALRGAATVYNLAGEMRVERGDVREVTVEVTRRGDDAGQLRVERSGERVSVVYPGDRVVYPRLGSGSRTSLEVGRDGSFGGGGRVFGGRRVTVSGSGRGVRAWADVRVLVPRGGQVAVHQGVGSVEVRDVNGELRVKTASAAVRTEDTEGALTVDVGSGGVEVSDADGAVSIDTGSGGVRLNNVRGPSLMVDTGSGGVRGENIRAERVNVDVGSGGVTLEEVDARNVRIDTGSGSVDVEFAGDAESVVIDTGSGGVTVALPERFGAELDIDTGSGGISVDVPAAISRRERSHFTGTVGDGEGRVVIDTGSGGVRVRRS
ncbi:MAG TPA: DUF4097 family beta strand repeat-containing protein [Longimicrobium sp.]|nr:DUF4097 family beta strand repeat-containing protein [Longimicrobium sp.]